MGGDTVFTVSFVEFFDFKTLYIYNFVKIKLKDYIANNCFTKNSYESRASPHPPVCAPARAKLDCVAIWSSPAGLCLHHWAGSRGPCLPNLVKKSFFRGLSFAALDP